MFSFLSNTMASASQRFFAFDLGRNDIPQLKRTFSLTVTHLCHYFGDGFAFGRDYWIVVLEYANGDPPDRMEAANWVYQFSILSFLVTIMVIPFNAVIIARENMAVYAYVSIIEVILKLVIVYLLLFFSLDKLKLYAVLMFATTCFVSFIYITICKRKYAECRFQFYWDKGLFYTLISYSGWNLFGAVAGVMNNQGINILLNMFFGPVVNAARGIAYQVNASVNQFVMNFHTAVRPQITKYYAAGEKDQMMSLVFKSSKYSYYLLFILSMPVLLETNYLLTLWLKNVPEYVVLFTRLVIITALIDSLSYPLHTAALATGEIKRYQLIVGGVQLMSLPISFCFLKLGFAPQITMVVAIFISTVSLFLRVYMLESMVGFSIRDYFRKVLLIISAVSVIAYVIPLYLTYQLGWFVAFFHCRVGWHNCFVGS